MFKGIIFFLWIACAMAAGEDSIFDDVPSQIKALATVIPQPRFPTATAQRAPIILGPDEWIQVDSQEGQAANGNQRQIFVFNVVSTPVSQQKIRNEVNRRREIAGRPPINQAFLTHLTSYFQHSDVRSVRLYEEWTENGQVVHSLTDLSTKVKGFLIDMHEEAISLEFGFDSASFPDTFYLRLEKPPGFKCVATLQQLGNAISKFSRVVFSEAKLTKINGILSESDDNISLNIIFPKGPITGLPQNAIRLAWTDPQGIYHGEFWDADDLVWGQLQSSRDYQIDNGFITDHDKNILNMKLEINLSGSFGIIEMRIWRNSEVQVKEAVPKLHEMFFVMIHKSVRPGVLKAIVEKVYQAPIGQVHKFTLTESDLEEQQLRLI